ncbi:SRPBCC family protein [Streptacidiphilus sp. EB103A]|uniref:SRPBCC family protein n=1 Tax=Streptacidiphilus sp. EB103A TaxID=3156275 RepID=UPI0035111D47
MAVEYQVSENAVIPAPVSRVWEVISATDRYAEWVPTVLEVTDHHGAAEVGRTYSERNKSLGPLTTRSTWTVREVRPGRRRVDTGTGFAPLQDVTNVFAFEPVVLADGGEGTAMTYLVRYRIGLGPIGALVHRVVSPGLRADMRTSMVNLSDLILAEGPGQ